MHDGWSNYKKKCQLTAISSIKDFPLVGEVFFWDSCEMEDDWEILGDLSEVVLAEFSDADELFDGREFGMVTEVGRVGRGYTRLSAVTSIISST